jgi:DNA-binding response OmpR family regulator
MMNVDPNLARVALLVNEHRHHTKVVQVARRLAKEPVHIHLAEVGDSLPYHLFDYDLILVEAIGLVNEEQQARLSQIRRGSKAPVVVFTQNERPERTIEGLLAGADAVISLTTALDVMVAHCRALLRRWQPRNYVGTAMPDFSRM